MNKWFKKYTHFFLYLFSQHNYSHASTPNIIEHLTLAPTTTQKPTKKQKHKKKKSTNRVIPFSEKATAIGLCIFA